MDNVSIDINHNPLHEFSRLCLLSFYFDGIELWKCGNEEMRNRIRAANNELDEGKEKSRVMFYVYFDLEQEKRVEALQEEKETLYLKKWNEAKFNGYKTQEAFIDNEVTTLENRYIEQMQDVPILKQWIDFLKEKKESSKGKTETNTKKEPPHFTRVFTSDLLQQLYTGLTTGKFLSIDTDKSKFDYVFGACDKPNDFEGLKWLKGKQYLRELLTPIRHPDIILAELEKLVPLYFIDKEGKGINLAKNKVNATRPDSKAIVRILKEATM